MKISFRPTDITYSCVASAGACLTHLICGLASLSRSDELDWGAGVVCHVGHLPFTPSEGSTNTPQRLERYRLASSVPIHFLHRLDETCPWLVSGEQELLETTPAVHSALLSIFIRIGTDVTHIWCASFSPPLCILVVLLYAVPENLSSFLKNDKIKGSLCWKRTAAYNKANIERRTDFMI